MTNKITLSKSDFSESVIRKALYWATEIGDWELDSGGDDWEVTINADGKGVTKFHRILNDFILRERLDAQTKSLRTDVIKAALTRLASGGK